MYGIASAPSTYRGFAPYGLRGIRNHSLGSEGNLSPSKVKV